MFSLQIKISCVRATSGVFICSRYKCCRHLFALQVLSSPVLATRVLSDKFTSPSSKLSYFSCVRAASVFLTCSRCKCFPSHLPFFFRVKPAMFMQRFFSRKLREGMAGRWTAFIFSSIILVERTRIVMFLPFANGWFTWGLQIRSRCPSYL